MWFKNAIFLSLLVAALFSYDAEGRKHRRRKEPKTNPDIKCTMDFNHSSQGRYFVDVRQAKIHLTQHGSKKTVKINEEAGAEICKNISQVLWKKLVEGKAEKHCANPIRILVREKRHSICLENNEENPDLKIALDSVQKLFASENASSL